MPLRTRVKSKRSRTVRVRDSSSDRRQLQTSVHTSKRAPCDDPSLVKGSTAHNPYPADRRTMSTSSNGDMANDDGPNLPAIFKSLPLIKDPLITETSISQDRTIQECLPFLAGEGRSLFDLNRHAIPGLEREKHIEYLHDCLGELPAGFVAFDAARPWLIYWTLTGLCLLGENVDRYRSR